MRHPVVAALLGLVVSFLVVTAFEALGHFLFPVDFEVTPENLHELIGKIPLESMIMVIIAHFLGGFAAVFTILKLAKKKLPAYIIGIVFFAMSVLNLFLIPHPTWFTIADVLAIILGMLLGFKLVKIEPKTTE